MPLLAQEGDQVTWTVAMSAKALQHIREGDAVQAHEQALLAMASAAGVSIAPP